MDPSTITQVISSVGFPIVAAGGLFWYMVTENKASRAVIENNTKALVQILEHVKKEEQRHGQ